VAGRDIVVIGGSAGAVEGLIEVVRSLPPDLPAAVFVVIHFPDRVTSALPEILSRAGRLPACHARNGEPIVPSRIYVAPPGCHLLLEAGRVRLSNGPKENGHRPAVDPLFRSAAYEHGPRVVGVVLSGNLGDGSAGLLSIKQHGGLAVVQDPETAVYDGMPRTALETTPVDRVVPLAAIAACVAELVRQPLTQDILMTADDGSSPYSADSHSAEATIRTEDRQQQAGVPSTMTCPECHGTLWEVHDGDLLRFRCRVGHAFGPEALFSQQAEALEAALWTALRALEEHAALNRRLAARAQDRRHAHSAAAFTEHAMTAEHHASIIRTVLERGVSQPAQAKQVEAALNP
jgi:two-component system, chemotaxis family, protein-glutamate methylesterase/glutaminase